ncbi:phosphoribosyltransferase [Melittangium boletus]|uniref:Phosphoribosyltransferase n=1 Tax=Melittangium boletus DSM 14713 TaxID=1294270 RepID=A0A250IEZ3_9BACT|nr:phosphoribosyltransferase [Melittangium boletus]ATB29818.1 phosphoribosyltransferase [Melittangium boletus DSM 14713]
MRRYRDRHHGGRVLASALEAYAGRTDVIVLALPRGGVPVGFEVARHLGARLDVFLVRKLGVPGHEELAMGALASGGVRVVDPEVVDGLGLTDAVLDEAARREARELLRRERLYRRGGPPPRIEGQTVILVDDGIATGSSMRAAVAALKSQKPSRLVVGVPTAAPSTCEALARQVDDIVCVDTPEPFMAVGLWYEDFAQTTDEEVLALLEQAARERAEESQVPGGM